MHGSGSWSASSSFRASGRSPRAVEDRRVTGSWRLTAREERAAGAHSSSAPATRPPRSHAPAGDTKGESSRLFDKRDRIAAAPAAVLPYSPSSPRALKERLAVLAHERDAATAEVDSLHERLASLQVQLEAQVVATETARAQAEASAREAEEVNLFRPEHTDAEWVELQRQVNEYAVSSRLSLAAAEAAWESGEKVHTEMAETKDSHARAMENLSENLQSKHSAALQSIDDSHAAALQSIGDSHAAASAAAERKWQGVEAKLRAEIGEHQ
eukprot:COSAG02_NODE_2473_length_8740_cov_335.972688_4_plen_269_part_01